MTALRVVIADDDVLLREGIASLLDRSNFEVVGQAGDAADLMVLVRAHRPDLVVTDIRMPPTHTTEGLEAARTIHKEFPATGVLVLSAHVEVEYAIELVSTGGGRGYLLKSRIGDVAEFVDALNRIAAGAAVLDPALVRELVVTRRNDHPIDALSQREREVLGVMAEGLSNAGIARRLWITESTVEKHVHNVMTKLNLTETDEYHRRVLAVITFLAGT
ncbi:response regulator [Mycobacteroides salmoniphilum]|uniref:response regulator n=1 Tax=Mycobacteroides salmoniphilum TaxID=404941 RepID=UPI0009932E90|nr:response regulator transcription factor [Mycobacteroides salmoniphilum]QCH22415.1 Transcriptional regulatory protein DegU [Mycobacteroides salmoniphilum]TDZ96957.1 Transcriptional regulatory protein DegU [Mycobacteroides salmoniphilum]